MCLIFPETEPTVRHSAQSLQQDNGGDTIGPQAARDILQSGFLWAGEVHKGVFCFRCNCNDKRAVYVWRAQTGHFQRHL